ncbi:transcriptional regulator [Amycolatopsis antarctica]|uniref:Transcriptional regulator n=1 Tax=Amycolatopsis antarctica TaxID=1854586 RepID=A0A263D4X2_9PSEU|nr:helix-turn-helix transcriptional regulator [Amycolatopsis antarctica]OZM73544.1 transcriptional regulator [Amycolatopsis antarctica]
MGRNPGWEPTARARELGGELRQARERAELTMRDLSRQLGWSPSKTSRIECGLRGVAEMDVVLYLANCGVVRDELERLLDLAREPDGGHWLRSHGERLPDELRSLVVLESTAHTITAFEHMLVPGMLQTEEYAREVFRLAERFPPDAVERLVRARMARQSLLHRRTPAAFTFYLHENALRSMVGGPEVMHEQVMKLLLACSWPNSTIRVVPRAAGAAGTFEGPFWFIECAEHPPVVYVQNVTASVFLDGAEHLDVYRRIVAKLARVALDAGQSRSWLARLAGRHDVPRSQSDVPPSPPGTTLA